MKRGGLVEGRAWDGSYRLRVFVVGGAIMSTNIVRMHICLTVVLVDLCLE